ncbi:MAG: ABC transporter substrate-binding protein, partial [Candidatus Omnitrophica bacterium]|nr:ABC transporter substrate-binding protein [Candidatus Omnitrophota bacterium]
MRNRTVYVLFTVLLLCSSSVCNAEEYRIISLAPNATEILFALGLEDFIVAVDRYSNYPEEARRLDKVGTFVNLDIEKIIFMKPNYLLVGASIDHGKAGYLRAIGVEIIKVSPESVDGLCKDILMLGNIFKKVDQATGIVNDIKDRV